MKRELSKKSKALSFQNGFRPYPHLWSWVLGNDRRIRSQVQKSKMRYTKYMGKGRWDDHKHAGKTTLKILDRTGWLGASIKRNVGCGGGPWCVAAQSWAAAPATFTDMSGRWRKNLKLMNFILS